ncbi:acyltransferase family protein, partial [bacterium]|nr:acyltransferase family protein [bacterium]
MSRQRKNSNPKMTKTMTTTNRRHDLDALRAIAMLLGIVLHTALSFSFMPWIVQDTQQHHVYGVIFSALHGFRIPLFFLVSGFFTAMLWQKRGLKSLLWHRFRRIFLPLLLGMITIIPAVTWISIIAMQSGSERVLSPAAASNSGQAITAQAATGEPKTDLWAAIRENDIKTLNQHIAQGADLTARDPKFGQTLLNLAALHDRTEIIEHLLEQGLPVNIQGADGSTALHSAAFLGNTQSIEILLQNGADVNIKNSHGQTPIDSAAVDWPTTQFIASLLKLDINKAKVQTRREEAAKLLRGAGATASNTTMGTLFNFMFMIPVFHHLWFLWFLCWLVAGFAVFAVFATWLGWKGASGGWILSPFRYLWLIPLTLLPQWYMSNPVFGPDTSVGLLPLPHVLLFYAMFFGFGALYYFSNDTAGRLGKNHK